jgi:hypothetical protein
MDTHLHTGASSQSSPAVTLFLKFESPFFKMIMTIRWGLFLLLLSQTVVPGYQASQSVEVTELKQSGGQKSEAAFKKLDHATHKNLTQQHVASEEYTVALNQLNKKQDAIQKKIEEVALRNSTVSDKIWDDHGKRRGEAKCKDSDGKDCPTFVLHVGPHKTGTVHSLL